MSRKQAVRWILSRIRERAATAVVRFGEGEGRLITASPSDAESVTVARNKIRRQTGLVLTAEEVFQIRALVMNGFDNADLVGIRGSRSRFNPEHMMWVDRIEAAFEERLADGRPPAHVSHCQLNNDLRDALPAIFQQQRLVSAISCRDIGSKLEAAFGVDHARLYQVPSQYTMRRIDGEYEAALHDVPIWPGFYERLRADLSVREPGEVFLIGAGLFAKDLCIRVKELGGIALDMGSCLDGLADKVTRGPNRPEPYAPPRP